MSFLGKTTFCTSGHAQPCWLCWVIQSDMLNIYHSPTHMFLSLCLSLPALCQLQRLSQLQQSPVLSHCALPDVVITTDSMPNQWVFFIQIQEFPSPIVASSLFLCTRCVFHCKNTRLLHSSCKKWHFSYVIRWLPHIWTVLTAKAFLCNQGGMASLFLVRLACCILNLDKKHGITFFPAYIPTHLKMEAHNLSGLVT